MKKELKNLDAYLQDAIQNIEEDRAITKTLLSDVVQYVKNSKDNHKDIGHIAAKYVETLQRSNEQLVKIASLLQKRSTESQDLTDKDKNKLFDIIKERS
jgi:nitrous oxide reductase